MGFCLSFLYLAAFWLAGWLVARRLCPEFGLQSSLVLGSAVCLLLLIGLPAVLALPLGFTPLAIWLALAAAALIGLAAYYSAKKADVSLPKQRPQAAFWWCVLPLFAFSCWLLHTHTLLLKDGAYWCGQSTFGDLPMHLAFIQSIAQQGSWPPVYPLLAGVDAFGYPFLCESVSSVFLLLGADLKLACILPQMLALFCVFGAGWQLMHQLLTSAYKASLAFWLFFMGSGFGFAYFLDGDKANFRRIFTAFYETPTNYVEKNIIWVNPIADLLIPQRATLFGWALLFPCLWLLMRFVFDEKPGLWPALVLLAAPLPLLHTHSAVALVFVCAALFLRAIVTGPRGIKPLAPWLCFAGATALLWLPQFFTQIFTQTANEGFLRWHFNWVNESDSYFWFYIKNIGLVYLLLIPAFLHASKALRWVYGGGLLILVVSEVIVFQPNNYDNNKLLFIWHLLGCILVANLLVDVLASIKKRPVRIALASLCIITATLGSVLTLGREAVSEYQQFSADGIAAGQYALQNTAPNARFLTGTQHINPISSLAGRSIMCTPTYVHFHGKPYSEQTDAIKTMYETPSSELLAQWGIEYVFISSWEHTDYDPDVDWFEQNCAQVFAQGECTIYKVTSPI